MIRFFGVSATVASTAEGEQVFQSVVAQLSGRSHASTVNVVDVQILSGSTALAGEVVTLQSLLAVASKVVVVLGLSDVFIPLGVLGQRSQSLRDSAIFSASWAVLLWPRCVREVSTTLNALKRAANCHCPLLLAKASEVKHILLLPVGGTALGAALLHGAGGIVQHLANDALALLESVAGLAVGSQDTRLASLEIGRCLRNLRPAVGALKDAVFPPLHNLNTTLSVL